jgi:hypothetical protein
MSLFANAYGNFLSSALPYYQAMPGIITPYGTLLKPGGRVAAYVRSTGAQTGEDHFASSGMLVATIDAGLARCRASQNDIVYVLPGHTETFSSTGAIWSNLVAGAQIIGVGQPGATNNPNITLSHTGASIALNVANVTLSGLNINSATAAVTGALVVTAAGVNVIGNYFQFTGALGANSPFQCTGAANFVFAGNNIVVDSTATMLAITGAGSTNFIVQGNIARQSQGTSGGSFSTTANTSGISGHYANNYYKTATTSTGGAGVIVLGAATITTVGNHENYGGEETAAASLLVTGA